MLVGLVGKPNVGKSSFFTAATAAPAEIGNYPFTTIEPNRGVGFIRHACAHVALGLGGCDPRTGTCVNGTRFIPVELLDVAGLVEGAHAGRGLGNKFLNDLIRADALVHVVDLSGSTNPEGEPVPKGSHDPGLDVKWLEAEVAHWIADIVGKDWGRQARSLQMSGGKLAPVLHERLTGLGVTENDVVRALDRAGIQKKPTDWGADEFLAVGREIRAMSKPLIIAANKADLADPDAVKRLQEATDAMVVPVSAQSELALRRANDAGVIAYTPGAPTFEMKDPSKLNDKQRKALDYIRTNVLDAFGSTGVQKVLEEAVYRLLDRIAVWPVEDETHYTDKEGRVLPDVHLLPKGVTARDLAYKVHTDLGEKFIRAIDVKSKRTVGADHELQDGDVIRIVAGK